MLSQGVPMLLAGDEIGHTQQGNNNAYCQDNELTWLNWDLNDRQQRFLEFTKKVSRIWREHPVFQRRKFFQGRALRGSDIKDISFLEPSGKEMSDEDWNGGFVKCLGVRLAGDLIGDVDERGEPIVDDTALILLNAHHEPISVHAAADTRGAGLGTRAGHVDWRRHTAQLAGGRSPGPRRSVTGRPVHARGVGRRLLVDLDQCTDGPRS